MTGRVARADPQEGRRKDRTAAEAAGEADRVGERLGGEQDEDDRRRALRDQRRDRGLAGEQDILRVGAEAVRQQRDEPHGETAREEERGHAEPARAVARDAGRDSVDRDDRQRGRNADREREEQVGEMRTLVQREVGDGETRRVVGQMATGRFPGRSPRRRRTAGRLGRRGHARTGAGRVSAQITQTARAISSIDQNG
jgi:hypothetical protein